VAFGVADGVAVGRRVGEAVAVGVVVGVTVAVGRRVGEAVAVGLAVAVALPVGVALALDVGASVGLAVAELLPAPPDEGEGVRDAPPEAWLVETCGLGVKTDGAVEEGDPPPLQAATAAASRAARGRPAHPARPEECRRGRSGPSQGRLGLPWTDRSRTTRDGHGQAHLHEASSDDRRAMASLYPSEHVPSEPPAKERTGRQLAAVPPGRHNSWCRRVRRSHRQPHIAAPAIGPAGGQWRVFHLDIRLRE
jgi:hypothetical protein